MTNITLDIPTTKNPAYFQNLFETLASDYTEEDIEDMLLWFHMSRLDKGDTITEEEFRSHYAVHHP